MPIRQEHIAPPTNYEEIETYMEKTRMKMGIRISVLFILTFTTLSITFRNDDIRMLTGYLAAILVAVVMLIVLLLYKRTKIVFALYGIGGSITALCSCFFILEATHYVDFIWIIVCTFVVFLGGYRKLGLALITGNSIGIAYFIFFRHNLHISTIQTSTNVQLAGAYLEIMLSLFVLAYLIYQFVYFQDYKDNYIRKVNQSLSDQNKVIEKQYQENVGLLKEIHHRVKNNLQVIVSLLRLQKHELDSEESRQQFQEAINRVLVMSSIHQKLYQQEDLANINLDSHLNDLIKELKMLFEDDKNIRININCKLKYIDLKTMVPVGLLINELLSNSFKYAFEKRANGQVDISVYPEEEGFNIEFKDNGIWKTRGDTKGFGLELVEIFTNQLDGTREFKTDELGTQYTFKLQFAN